MGATFPREAAVALAMSVAGNGDAAEATANAARVDALVDLALVEALADRRLRLHPVLRDYAAERLRALESP